MKGANLETCVVRLEDENGQTRGTGFVVTPSLAVTCAHVVEACGAGPGERVRLVFHAGGGPVEAEVMADDWHSEADVAFLRLPELLPEGVTPAILTPSAGREGARVRAFGYPEVGKVENLWGTGELVGRVMEAGRKLLQLRSSEITVGFSGGPVWDATSGHVIGMVTQIATLDRYGKLGEVAFAVPAETLCDLSGEVDLHRPFGCEAIRGLLADGLDHFFISGYERLRDAYIKPWSVFERVRLDRFVGREWLTNEVDSFLREEDRGYFVLEAGAGLGKTTLLAHLTQERGYVHHFVELARGSDGVVLGLRNLAVQVIRAWELNYSADEVLLGAVARPDFLQNLLFEAARRRDEIKPGEKIVLVVDALDEAGTPYGQNVLGLPRVLPEQVYFIVSQRPVRVPLQVEGPRRPFRLEAGEKENRTDMQAYLEAAATWGGVAQAMGESGYTAEQFVSVLLEKCQGVWIYLYYIVDEIERGKRSPLDLAALPDGMWQYYVQLCTRWQEQYGEKWERVHLPLLATLAAAQETVSLERLCLWTGIAQRPGLRQFLGDELGPYLVEEGDENPRYRLYHASFQEFLSGQVGLRHLPKGEQSLAHGMAEAVHHAHARIADWYLEAWGSLDVGLPGLQDPEKRNLDGGYGLRHLVTHLERAGRVDAMHRLLWVEWRCQEEEPYRPHGWRGLVDRLLGRRKARIRTSYENAWQLVHEQVGDLAGYLNDVTRAWWLAEEASAIGLQSGYALVTASLNSLAANIPPALLAALVEKEVWAPIQALVYAWQMPDPTQRAEALTGLVPYLPESLLWAALAMARQIESESVRVEVLAKLLPHLPETLLREALAAACEIKWEPAQAEVLVEPSCLLAELGYPDEALTVVRAVNDQGSQARMLAKLAPHLSEGFLRKALVSDWMGQEAQIGLFPRLVELGYCEEALSEACGLPDSLKAQAIISLAPILPKALLWEALAHAWSGEDEGQRAGTVVELAPYLTEPQLREASAAAQEFLEQPYRDHATRAKALAELVPRLVELGYLEEALATTQEIEREEIRAETLIKLAPHLPESLLRKALDVAQRIQNRGHRATVLPCLISRLAELSHPEEALAIAHDLPEFVLGYGSPQAVALAKLAPHLAEPLLREALAITWEIQPARAQADTLVGLAPYLPESLLPEALALAKEIEWERLRAEALAGLTPRLSGPLLWDALGAAREIQDRSHQALALSALIPRLAELGYIKEAFAATRLIRHSHHFADAQTTILYYQPAGVLARILVDLAPRLSEPMLRKALVAVREIGWAEVQIEALIELAPYLPDTDRIEVIRELAAAHGVWLHLWLDKEGDQAKKLADLARQLPERERAQYLREALAAMQKLPDEASFWGYRSSVVLFELAPYLPSPLLQEAMGIARALPAEVVVLYKISPQVEALLGLALHLSEPERSQVLQEALTAVGRFEPNALNEYRRAAVLAKLAPHLPESLLREALDMAREIHDQREQSVAMAGLISRLAELGCLKEALVATQEINQAEARVKTIVGLIPRLAELGYLREALAATREINQVEMRVEALVQVASHLEEPESSQILQEALAVARMIGNSKSVWSEDWLFSSSSKTWSKVLTELVPHLPESLKSEALQEALAAAREIRGPKDRAQVLADLALLLLEPERGQALKEALAAAREIRSPKDRAQVLADLALLLLEPERGQALKEALAAARELSEGSLSADRSSAIALTRLAPLLTESQRAKAFKEALAIIRETGEHDGAKLLTELAPRLPGHLLQEALAVVRNIQNEDFRAEALTRLLPRLAELGHFEEALSLAQSIEKSDRPEALTGLVSQLTELNRLEEALAVARELPEFTSDKYVRANALAELGPHLPETLLQEALMVAREQHLERARAKALIGLAPYLPEPLLREVLIVVWSISNRRDRSNALARLAPHLPEPLLWEALDAALDLYKDDLTALVPRLAELGYPDQALAMVSLIHHPDYRATALARLASHLPGGLLQDTLTETRALQDKSHQAEALVALIWQLGQLGYPQEALSATRLIQYVDYWEEVRFMLAFYLPERFLAEALIKLAPYLSKPLLQEALKTARAIEQDQTRVKALIGVAQYLPMTERWNVLQEALRAVWKMKGGYWRAEILAGLVPRLAESGHPQQALGIARKIDDERWKDEALAGLAPYLSGPLLRKALKTARRAKALTALVLRLAELGSADEALALTRELPEFVVGYEHLRVRAQVLARLAPYLPKSLLWEAVDMAQHLEQEGAREEALVELAPRLAELGHPTKALKIVRGLPEKRAWIDSEIECPRVKAMVALVPHLPDGMRDQVLGEALATAQAVEWEGAQAEALARLAPHLPEPLLWEALATAREIWREETWRAEALAALFLRLAELGQPEQALAATREVELKSARAEGLTELAPYLPEPLKVQALGEALVAAREIESERARTEALNGLTPHLTEGLLGEALAVAREIGDADDRTKALEGLAPRLAELPPDVLRPLWCETLHVLASRTRRDLLSDIRALASVIAALGGPEAVMETLLAIQYAGRWWP